MIRIILALGVLLLLPEVVRGQPALRDHTETRAINQRRVAANQKLPTEPQTDFSTTDSERVMRVNGIPSHLVGRFPNRGNPHAIEPVEREFRVTLDPKVERRAIPVGMNNFGIAVNGVLFDPAAAEYYRGNPRLGWQYEALGGAVPLGLDENEAHVQPDGNYHYHGLPRGLLKQLGMNSREHSPLVGWAADGFPIYAVYGYKDPKNPDSEIVALKSSYQLKEGERPGRASDRRQPAGKHDGAFVNDYEYVRDSGELDECNGRFTVTPEFPNGIYAYFLTEEWPVVPRFYRGEPHASFEKRPGAGPRGAGPRGAGPRGAGPRGAGPRGAGPRGPGRAGPMRSGPMRGAPPRPGRGRQPVDN